MQTAMRVLVATDASDAACTATRWLRAFPLPSTAEIIALATIAPMPPVLDVPFPPAMVVDAAAHAHDAAHAAVAMLGTRWPGAIARVVDGDPRHLIPETAAGFLAERFRRDTSGIHRGP